MSKPELQSELTLFDVTNLVVGAIIGVLFQSGFPSLVAFKIANSFSNSARARCLPRYAKYVETLREKLL